MALFLQSRLGKRVFNAGVCGYGVGQTFQRGKQLLEHLASKTVLIRLIPADIRRTEAKLFYDLNKPSFSKDQQSWSWQYQHIALSQEFFQSQEEPSLSQDHQDDSLKIQESRYNQGLWKWAGYSYFLSTFPNLRNIWLQWQRRSYSYAHHDGVQVICYLWKQVDQVWRQKYGVTPVVVLQYKSRDVRERLRQRAQKGEPGLQVDVPGSKADISGLQADAQASLDRDSDLALYRDMMAVKQCAMEQNIRVFDSFDPIAEYLDQHGEEALSNLYIGRFGGHMSPVGNRLIADAIAPMIQAETNNRVDP